MDVRTTSLIGLGFLLVVVSFSMLGLAADNVAYVNGHQNDDLQIHYHRWNSTAETQYSYWLKMDYAPSRFTLARESAMIASGVICAVVGAVVISTSTFVRKANNTRTGALPWLITSVFAAVAFAISLAVAVYAWYPMMQWNINFLKSLPVPAKIAGSASDTSITYQAPYPFTPEFWNCALAPYVANPEESGRLQSLCQEAHAAKSLTIPVVILAAAIFGLTGWSWWSASSAARAEPEMEGKDVEEVSMASRD
ncbi:hypothetical protein LTR09_000873 [Extremus antarcticus]|uniref:Uncharacterized protein n=1 Tax=Extremus antarcticus TaxID=702011 RepID=A0AAJ0GHT8_9PEZI|nr:hypothetical protein LTR09_000873 [Extremus antarcticus]